MRSTRNPGKTNTTEESETAFGRYTLKSFRNDQREHGPVSRTEDEFLLSVRAQLVVELEEKGLLAELGSPEEQLREFDRRLEEAMAEDRRSSAYGQKASKFESLPERKTLVAAIRKAIAAERRPKRKFQSSLAEAKDCEDMRERPPEARVLVAEAAEIVIQALQRLDSKDQAILRARYFDDAKQVEIAQRQAMPPQTVNRRLHNALAKMAEDITQSGYGE
jgi:RNA polymerase sigma factor (sigma-70 family)